MANLPPVRCFTCGKVVASLIVKFWNMVNLEDADPDKNNKVASSLGLTRMCCRRMVLAYVPEPITYYISPESSSTANNSSTFSSSAALI